MTITAKTSAVYWGAPPPLYCGPKTTYPRPGWWNHKLAPRLKETPCTDPGKIHDSSADKKCKIYPLQRGGGWSLENVESDKGAPNQTGRTDVERCCWWGRGVIQTTGACNIGKLNKALENAKYFKNNEDLCKTPELICDDNINYPDLKWISGLFFWISEVQPYTKDSFNYINVLKNKGNTEEHWVRKASTIVNRGCAKLEPHDSPCGTGELHGMKYRKDEYDRIYSTIKS